VESFGCGVDVNGQGGNRAARLWGLLPVLALALASGAAAAPSAPRPAVATQLIPISHVVIVYQENHSFDEVLGGLCLQDARCDAASTGTVSTGQTIPLHAAPDIPPNVVHRHSAQTTAIHGGRMDRFDLNKGCGADTGYACYEQYAPAQIPNLAALARAYALSDRTFENGPVPSWGSHFGLVAAQFDGFVGDDPAPGAQAPGPGWGCDSFKDTSWIPPGGGATLRVPSCIPKPDGSGPYRASPVQWIPTIMDRLDQAGLPWRIYAASASGSFAICPTFAECLYGPQARNVKGSKRILTDAAAGTLPALSIVTPSNANSQHNGYSMLQGDNWIGQVVSAIMNGPQWGSTAIFITYDDCGCFYDHVAPPPGLGIRVPMVIVSPWARPGYTDSTPATFASMLAFVEHTFGLAPLAAADASAYDYSSSFDYAQSPLPAVALAQHALPPGTRAQIAANPPDPNDPT
jgi:phospholipase C